ncbi:MAG: DUF5655 domain-containing protein [Euzebya sp.]
MAQKLIGVVGEMPQALIEPVQVGLFFKRTSSFAQLRTMTRWTALSVKLPRVVSSPSPRWQVESVGSRHHHVFNLHDITDVTPAIIDLLWEAYDVDVR